MVEEAGNVLLSLQADINTVASGVPNNSTQALLHCIVLNFRENGFSSIAL